MQSLLKTLTESPLGKTALGVVVLMCFAGMYLQFKTLTEDARLAREQLFTLFQKHSQDTTAANTRQWQNAAEIAKAVNAMAIAMARIEALLHIPPAERPRATITEPPKMAEVKPPEKS